MGNVKVAAVIAAAGSGRRMGDIGKNKVFLQIEGKSVIARTVAAFEDCEYISEIIVVAREDEIIDMWNELVDFDKVTNVVAGGETRTESTLAGLERIGDDITHVAFHDGARPLVTAELISKTVNDALTYGNAIVGVPETDTVKRVNTDNLVCETLPREALWRIQTPQVFNVEEFMEAVIKSGGQGFTDDSAFIENAGGKVYITSGSYDNIKITTPEDISLAEKILAKRKV